MAATIGIRREDKNIYERRTPIIPEHIRELSNEHSIDFVVEPSKIRVFTDDEYSEAGAKIDEDLSGCDIIFSIKELPLDFIMPGKTYVFFSHTIKGQEHNMPMLEKLIELNCTLIDYEKVVNDKGFRLIFFGRHAGLAGMIGALWALGKRLDHDGISNPFGSIDRALDYHDLAEIKTSVRELGENIKTIGIPKELTPLIIGIMGYGNVSKGVQEILDELPLQELEPNDLNSFMESGQFSQNHVYKVVFKEEDMVEPISPDQNFELHDYWDHPEKYKSKFEPFIPHMTVMMNCIYWDERYPKFISKNFLKDQFSQETPPKLKVIGDISCDIEGAVEATSKATDPGNPIYVYDPIQETSTDGWKGDGLVILAVDTLPSELPRDSSQEFSSILKKFIPDIAKADYSLDFEQLNLPPEIKTAVITYQGELAPEYKYIDKFLSHD
jgi:alpha-aminoadipic semialdehyde synthase